MFNSNEYPRLLVVGNCCLSNVTSNGRTLKNFLIGWPKEKIAQLCVRFDYPDFEVCENYFCVPDRKALEAFLIRPPKKEIKHNIMANDDEHASGAFPNIEKKIKRNAMSMYFRDIVWGSGRWQLGEFNKWINDFSPELILFQAGDFGYFCRLVDEISKERSIPIVVYNSESYYLKKFDYLNSTGVAKLFYPLFRHRFCRNFERMMKRVSSAVYICDMLKEDYEKIFNIPSYTIRTVTENSPPRTCIDDIDKKIVISYLGNLDVGRHESLVEIGDALQSISKDLYLDVYGKIPNENVKNLFDRCCGINYQGFVSYERVKAVMEYSDIIIHVENFSDYSRRDLKYAFSTKIADSLASGRCFVLYAPEEIAVSQYLIKNDAAHVICNKNELVNTLEKLIMDEKFRTVKLSKAEELVKRNHSVKENSRLFQQILLNAVKK